MNKSRIFIFNFVSSKYIDREIVGNSQCRWGMMSECSSDESFFFRKSNSAISVDLYTRWTSVGARERFLIREQCHELVALTFGIGIGNALMRFMSSCRDIDGFFGAHGGGSGRRIMFSYDSQAQPIRIDTHIHIDTYANTRSTCGGCESEWKSPSKETDGVEDVYVRCQYGGACTGAQWLWRCDVEDAVCACAVFVARRISCWQWWRWLWWWWRRINYKKRRWQDRRRIGFLSSSPSFLSDSQKVFSTFYFFYFEGKFKFSLWSDRNCG